MATATTTTLQTRRVQGKLDGVFRRLGIVEALVECWWMKVGVLAGGGG